MTHVVKEHLKNFPIILVEGPRQAGKTTMVTGLARDENLTYLSVDDEVVKRDIDASAKEFVARLDRAVIDEIQERPDLLKALKLAVDQRGGNGHFILTGSASIKAQRRITDLLAGRMCVLTLLPLAQSELRTGRTNFLNYVFSDSTDRMDSDLTNEDLQKSIICGGYPALQSRPTRRQRSAWLRHYLAALNLRDIPHLRDQKVRVNLKQLLTIFAGWSGSRLNIGKVSTKLNLQHATCKNYLELVKNLYVIRRLRAFDPVRDGFSDAKQRKLVFNDTGLLSMLLGVSEGEDARYRKHAGQLMETFVYSEIAKLCSWADDGHNLGYWFDPQYEVDLVIEHRGSFVGIETKHTTVPRPDDFKGLLRMAKQLGKRMVRGIVICRCQHMLNYEQLSSQTSVPMQTMPVAALWTRWQEQRSLDLE